MNSISIQYHTTHIICSIAFCLSTSNNQIKLWKVFWIHRLWEDIDGDFLFCQFISTVSCNKDKTKKKNDKERKKFKIEIKIIDNNFQWLKSNQHYDWNEKRNGWEKKTIIKVLLQCVYPIALKQSSHKYIAFQSDNTIR